MKPKGKKTWRLEISSGAIAILFTTVSLITWGDENAFSHAHSFRLPYDPQLGHQLSLLLGLLFGPFTVLAQTKFLPLVLSLVAAQPPARSIWPPTCPPDQFRIEFIKLLTV